jgi:hypothetical protein
MWDWPDPMAMSCQGSDRTVSFEGRRAITIPAGAPLLTDPIDLPVRALDRLVISSYLPGPRRARVIQCCII